MNLTLSGFSNSSGTSVHATISRSFVDLEEMRQTVVMMFQEAGKALVNSPAFASSIERTQQFGGGEHLRTEAQLTLSGA